MCPSRGDLERKRLSLRWCDRLPTVTHFGWLVGCLILWQLMVKTGSMLHRLQQCQTFKIADCLGDALFYVLIILIIVTVCIIWGGWGVKNSCCLLPLYATEMHGGFLCKRILLSSSLAHRIFMHLSFGGDKPAASHWCNLLNGVHSPIWLRMPPTPLHCMHESVWFTPFLSLPTAVPPFTISVSFHLSASHPSCAHCSDTISSYNSPNLSVILLFSKSSGVCHSASRAVCRWGGGHTLFDQIFTTFI